MRSGNGKGDGEKRENEKKCSRNIISRAARPRGMNDEVRIIRKSGDVIGVGL